LEIDWLTESELEPEFEAEELSERLIDWLLLSSLERLFEAEIELD